MSRAYKAYQVVYECPKGKHTINLQKRCTKGSLTEKEATRMFRNERITCVNRTCGWHGKASQTKVIRIIPFAWIMSAAA